MNRNISDHDLSIQRLITLGHNQLVRRELTGQIRMTSSKNLIRLDEKF
jgi:hypothetical protein